MEMLFKRCSEISLRKERVSGIKMIAIEVSIQIRKLLNRYTWNFLVLVRCE